MTDKILVDREVLEAAAKWLDMHTFTPAEWERF